MNVVLCVDIFQNKASNDKLSKKVLENYKYLSTGDEITCEYLTLKVVNKRMDIESESLFIYCEVNTERLGIDIKEIIRILKRFGFNE